MVTATKDRLEQVIKNFKYDEVKESKRANNNFENNMIVASLNDIQYKRPGGGTNVYVAAVSALDILKYEDDAYSKTIVLMTDGQSINDYDYLYDNYIYNSYKIPIYSITFGDADPEQLEQIAALTNAKVFDGKTDLLKAFKEVRSFS